MKLSHRKTLLPINSMLNDCLVVSFAHDVHITKLNSMDNIAKYKQPMNKMNYVNNNKTLPPFECIWSSTKQ